MKLLVSYSYIMLSNLLLTALISCKQPEKPKVQSNKTLIKQPANVINSQWIGTWERDDQFDGAELTVTRMVKDSIEFTLTAQSGGHSGDMDGIAFVKHNVAHYQPVDDKACKATFIFKGDSIILKANGCGAYAGIGVTFDGKYVKSTVLAKSKKLSESGSMRAVLTAGEDSVFKKLVGKDYQTFLSCNQLTYDGDNLDTDLQAKVMSGAVRGLFTSMENIIMIDSARHVWAAVIEDSEKVNYYTNDKRYANKLPKTIDSWRQNFKDYPVIYKSK
jgi:hypothetical protein